MVSTVVIGGGGYSGAELVSILLGHSLAQIKGVFASSRRAESGSPTRLDEVFARFRGLTDLALEPTDLDRIVSLKPDYAFLATPHEASVDLAPTLLEAGILVIDLSGAFRLSDPTLYPIYYGFRHANPDLLASAVYGLPEINRTQIVGADLIAAPGCYPTSAILPLAPLVKHSVIQTGTRPIVDSVSGVSGAGRSPNAKTHFCEVSLQPYNVLEHRHNPEIDQHAGTPVVFTPHLAAFDRGILSTIHVELAPGWTGDKVRGLLEETYEIEPFVRLLPDGHWPAVAHVRQTNFCDIGLTADDEHGHLVMASAIDNLVKGAAGQAVQCMNIRADLPETEGLLGGKGYR